MNDHHDDPRLDSARLPDPVGGSDDAAAQDLRATADAIRADLTRLAAVEADKQELHPADPRVDELSLEAVALAERLGRATRAERQLADEIG